MPGNLPHGNTPKNGHASTMSLDPIYDGPHMIPHRGSTFRCTNTLSEIAGQKQMNHLAQTYRSSIAPKAGYQRDDVGAGYRTGRSMMELPMTGRESRMSRVSASTRKTVDREDLTDYYPDYGITPDYGATRATDQTKYSLNLTNKVPWMFKGSDKFDAQVMDGR